MMAPALVPGTRLGHFKVIEYLGGGGMGHVYRARDERLKRDVALKVLPEDLMADPVARARLLREARSAAALNHPHICTIHEVGEDDSRVFIAMELVTGRPLGEVAGKAGLPPSTIVRIGSEIAAALQHAHEHGVIHRDLKSANVMLTSGARVKVMDFGVAKQVAPPDPDPSKSVEQTLTEPGAIVGTTSYMAPEALAGAPADARSDLWALGVLLYEMVAGELPFAGHTHYEVAGAIMHSDPRPLPATVSAGLRSIIAHCLEKDPARRYQHASDVGAALEVVASSQAPMEPAPAPRPPGPEPPPGPTPLQPWQVAVRSLGVLLAVLAIAIIIGKIWEVNRPPTNASASSLAVLPLENLSHDPEQAYFADGMTEEISTRLAQISALRVIAQSSVSDLVRRQKSLSDIGRALGVPVLLRGSVLRVADRVRISVQLLKAATGVILWSDSYEQPLLDVLTLQSQVALAIAHQIQVKLTPQEVTRLSNSRPIDPEAYQAYLKGRAVWDIYTVESFQEAERHFRHAIDLAPDYAPAWSGLADAIYGLSSLYLPPNEAIPKAREAAQRALALDETLPEAHTSLGITKMVYDWDWAGAEKEFDRAIELRPGDSRAHFWRGKLLVIQGRFDDGIADIRKALDLDPLSLFVSSNLAWHLYYARRYDEALRHLRGAMAADPDYGFFDFILGLILEQKGDHAGAVAALEKSGKRDVGADNLAQLAHAYASAGRRADAERTIAKIHELEARQFVPAADLAYAYAGIGEKEKAFQQLDLALADHSEMLTYFKVDPGMDPLRSDPRFDRVLRQTGLVR